MNNFQYKSHSVGQNSFHFVWCPKHRIPFLKIADFKGACIGLIKSTCIHNRFKIHELEVMPDHVHLFVEIPPDVSVSKAFQLIKGRTSRVMRQLFPWLKKRFRKGNLWSPGKFYRSVGSVTGETIKNYIKYSQHSWKHVKPTAKKTFHSMNKANTQSKLLAFA